MAGRHIGLRTTTTREKVLAGSLVGGPQVIIDSLAGLLAQFESDGPPSFLLSNRCAICRVATTGDILDSNGDDVAAAKLAVDCQIEHREVPNSAYDLELVRMDQTCLGRSGGFAPVSLPLFEGTRLWGVGIAITSSCIVILLGYSLRGSMGAAVKAFESGQLLDRF